MSDADTPANEEAARRIEFCLRKGRDHLNLNGFQLTELPQDFAKLTGLRYLDLTNNRLTKLPNAVSKFTDLRWLGLNDNRLAELPSGISKLKQLERLYLRNNRLQNLPKSFGNLTSLVELDLHNNRIANLPKSFLKLLVRPDQTTPLYYDLDDNPGQVAAVASQGVEQLRSYLRQLSEDAVVVPQGKLLLVGEGRMGKTTILRALQGKDFVPGLSATHGLNVDPIEVGHGEQPVKLNCWDFSGQKEMRETHQIFFTAPAVYLLVWNARAGAYQGRLLDWLWLIKQRTEGKARVLIVAAQSADSAPEPENTEEIRKLFGGAEGMLVSPEFIHVECDPDIGLRGIEQLREAIEQIVAEDDSFRQTIPANWDEAQRALDERRAREPSLNRSDFDSFCRDQHDIEDPAAFARVEHQLGRLVWIERGLLKDWVILNPDWLSKAIGYVLHDKSGREAKAESDGRFATGLLPEARIESTWQDPGTLDELGQPEPGYSPGVFHVFHALMEAFDLSHPIGDLHGERQRLIPNRLSATKPDAWDAHWNPPPDTLRRRIELLDYNGAPLNNWLVSSFLFRLMVRMHPDALGRQDYQRAAHWLLGFRLDDEAFGCARVFRQSPQSAWSHCLYFEGYGVLPAGLWGSLRRALKTLADELGREFRYRIDLRLTVPCDKACPRATEERIFLDEQKLCQWVTQGVTNVPCTLPDCGAILDARKLLFAIAPETSLERRIRELSETQETMHETLRESADDAKAARVAAESVLDRQESLVQHMQNTSEAMLSAIHDGREISTELRQDVEGLRANIREVIQDALAQLDEPSRHGPRLFSLTTTPPKFLSDAGRSFEDKYFLHLHCEQTLLPVAWLKDTADRGVWPIKIPQGWWAKAQPYVRATARLLSWFAPAAGLLLEKDHAKLIVNGAKQAGELEKIIGDSASLPGEAPTSEIPDPQSATDETLSWLRAFLIEQTGIQDLSQAETHLGLVRVPDKRDGTYRWIHRSEIGPFGGK